LTPEEKKEIKSNTKKISFVGISNWDIDASKQNRNLYVARPDLAIEDLKTTANEILVQGIKSFNGLPQIERKLLKTVVGILSESYYDFRQNQSKKFSHKNFHTLRDFYWMIKVFSRLYTQEESTDKQIFKLVANSIDINFSGIYSLALSLQEKKTNQERQYVDSNYENKNVEFRSNIIFKEVFKNKIEQFSERFGFSTFDVFKHKSEVVSHVNRALGEVVGRYLLLFLDRPLTSEILLENLKK
jgi:hypothetical protein